MNAQNNTPQQRPAAAASTPTESDLWEAAFSSDDPTVVLTDEELNAARRAHEKAREAASSAQSSAQSSQDATRPHRGGYRNPAAPLPQRYLAERGIRC